MSHLFGGIMGGVVFGLVSGLLLGSCVFEGGPNQRSVSGAAPTLEASAEAEGKREVPGGMDPGSEVMQAVSAKISELKRAVEKNPNDRMALVDLGNLYYEASKYDQAISYYERALALKGDDPNILTDTATCYWFSGNPAKALELLREAQAKFPNHWQSAANLFFLAASRRDNGLAGEALERVRSLNPNFERLPEMEKIYEDLNRGGRG